MRLLSKSLLFTCAALVLVATTAAVGFAQLREPPELLRRLWPFGRQHRPVPLADDTPAEDAPPAKEDERRLIAPFAVRKVDVNTATLQQLQNLPGVTSAMGTRIFVGRPYRNCQDLERDGVPLNVVRGLRGKITFGR